MPIAVEGTPTSKAQSEFAALRAALDDKIPSRKEDENLLVATWNIRAFGNYTRKWHSDDDDSPKRDYYSLRCITEILSRFDVIAIQEATSNLRCIRDALKLLGPHWGMLLTDVTEGKSGNKERLAFLFDTRRCKPSGLAGELVVPPEQTAKISSDALQKQFARTPYAVSFQAGRATFILVTLHVLWGKSSSDRIPELKGIANWLHDWNQDTNAWGHNFIALGDFNIDRKDDDGYKAFTSTGLQTAPGLMDAPRTVFDPKGPGDKGHFYDQIAWFPDDDGNPSDKMHYTTAGHFDFRDLVHTDLSNTSLSWRISDHFPLWTEFVIPRKKLDEQ